MKINMRRDLVRLCFSTAIDVSKARSNQFSKTESSVSTLDKLVKDKYRRQREDCVAMGRDWYVYCNRTDQ